MKQKKPNVLCALAAVAAALATHAGVSFPELSAPRAVTHGPHDHFLANYFGINAWSPDNRYVLALETDLKDEMPDGRPCMVGLVDLNDGNRFIPVMETRTWNFQEAAMAHWLPNERDTFLVNDLRDGKFVAVVKNWRTGRERVVPHPVSAVSEDGSWALSINYARLYLTRPDYGYAGEGQDPRRGVVFPEDDGLWRVDLKTGEARLIVSCAALKDMVPAVRDTGMSYICHTVISKDMKRIYFLSRSVDKSFEGVKKFEGVKWHTTAFTCDADGKNIRHCFPDGWGSSHFNWKPALSERDARTMVVTCNWQNKVYAHVEFTVGEEDKAHQVGGDAMNFDGHCIYTPDGNFVSGDGYWDDKFFRHWKMVRLSDNAVKDIGDFFVPETYRDIYCRCDLHPRWRDDGRQLAFNSVHEGSRQIYVIDAKPDAPRGEWFREARFGMFIHWGLYSVPARGEWIYARHPWKPGEFEALARTWNPTNYNPREWARLAKRAGMKYGVLTTRHHDGFCMFDSHFSDFKITNTPYGKDAVREYVEAFRAEGLKVGFYHSLPDWRHPGYSDPESPDGIQGRPLHKPTPEEHAAFQELVRNHVRQLLTEYGKIDLLFLDYTSKYKQEGDYFDCEKILKIAYECQPDIIVNDRLSFWKDNVRDFDYYTPEICVPARPITVKGREVSWETCATMNGSWGYRRDDNAWKTPEALVAGLVGCVSRNGNLLLNVGPTETGEIPAPSVQGLSALGDWYAVNGESIFGCGKSDFTPPFGCAYTQKGNTLYLHFLQPPLGDVILPEMRGRIGKMTLLRTGEEVKCIDNWGFELLAKDDQRIRATGVKAGDVVKILLADAVLRPALIPMPQKVVLTEGVCPNNAPIAKTTDTTIPAEGYRLEIAPDGVKIASSDAAGAFYAEKTLAQFGDGPLPCCRIEDAPKCRWRGFMIDDARHFFGKGEIKRLIDVMADYKYNVFHWHLTNDQGWRLAIDKWPRLAEVGSVRRSSPPPGAEKGYDDERYGPFFYTKDEIREIVAYARERHIEVVPEINFPGHVLSVLAAYPELSCRGEPVETGTQWGVSEDVLCAGNDMTMQFLKDVMDEVCDMFPAEVLHLGGDEAPRTRWNKCPKCQSRMKALGFKDVNELQGWMFREVQRHVAAKGRKAMGWEVKYGGADLGVDAEFGDTALPKDAIVQNWRTIEAGIDLATNGYEVVMSPYMETYYTLPVGLGALDPFPYRQWTKNAKPLDLQTSYLFSPFSGIPNWSVKNVLGGEVCAWTESTHNRAELEWKMFPRALAHAEAMWTDPQPRDFDEFSRRAAVHRLRLLSRGINCSALHPGK